MDKPSFSICTLGCRVNQYESGKIHAKLVSYGFVPADFSDNCDIYIINTCTITSESDRKCRQMIRRAHIKKPSALIFVCGCYSEVFPEKMNDFPFITHFCGNGEKEAVADEIYSRFYESPPLLFLDSAPPSFQSERSRAYIKIEDGCENKCSYCIIPLARGKVVSKPEIEIVSEAYSLAENHREIVLTGIETASYGRDTGTSLPALFEKLGEIEKLSRIRCGSLDPSLFSVDFIDKISKMPKVMPFFHISMQSGSNSVLAGMRRKYNTHQIEEGILYLREQINMVTISYDIIVGFPGESENDFIDTCDFIKRTKPLHMHIFTYSPREGTDASRFENQIKKEVKIRRSHELSALGALIKQDIIDFYIQSKTKFKLLTEHYKNGFSSGHTENFIEVKIKGKIEPNSFVEIRLSDFDKANNIIYGECV